MALELIGSNQRLQNFGYKSSMAVKKTYRYVSALFHLPLFGGHLTAGLNRIYFLHSLRRQHIHLP